MKMPVITHESQLAELVHEIGFLPMFSSCIEGYSLQECTPKSHWFVSGVDGPWQWKGYVLDGTIAYGKFLNKCAAFIDISWLPDFCNYRRDGYDFEGFFEDGHTSYKHKALVDTLAQEGPLTSRALKDICGYREGGEKGFETAIMHLQMQSFVTTAFFEGKRDKFGNPYGWELARYALMEQAFGEEVVNAAESRTPAESKERMRAQIASLWPQAEPGRIEKLIR